MIVGSVGSRPSAVGGPGGSIRLAAILGLLVFLISFVYAEPLDTLRKPLLGQSSAPDFADRLEKSLDKAATSDDALSLLAEFFPAVKDSEAERRLLLRWASLLELSGRWEEAASRYEEAAFAVPGRRDTDSLLASARDWLAAGETEKASAILKVLGVASADKKVQAKARVLEGWAALIAGRPEEAQAIADASAAEATVRETQLAALVLLWASSNGSDRAAAAARISKGFPGSPEAAMVESGEVPPAAHWLLTQAGGATRPASAPKPGSPIADFPASGAANPETKPEAKPASAPEPKAVPEGSAPTKGAAEPFDAGSSRVAAYQIGAFSEEGNATALVKELGKKGFPASIVRKDRGGRTIWSVIIQAGADADALLLRLKDAGYEAYPIF
jgi:cell division septation protein DedD